VIVENSKVYEKVAPNLKELKNIKHVIAIDPKGIPEDKVLTFDQLMEKGKTLRDKYEGELQKRVENIDPDDTYTIIYTSGTTGVPKGVMQTHRNEDHQMRVLPPHLGLEYGKERLLSILPIWHTFERMVEYITIGAGCTTVYTNLRDLKQDLREQKPTFMASAPRLWEQIYLGIYNSVQSGSGVKKTLFKMAYALSRFHGKAVRFLQGNWVKHTPPNPIVSFFRAIYFVLLLPINYPFFKLLDTIVLKKVRAATGGQMKGTLSGGGALPRHVDEFFNNIGINVFEGYGMTESGPVVCVRNFSNKVVGSIGPLVPEVEVEIRDFDNNPLPRGQKGVLWTKGPHVMKGYYKMPEQTAKTVVDGWLNTGDMALKTFNKPEVLVMTGRAKETIVLLGGENVEPVPIENKILESEYIGQIMVVGQDQKWLGALIYPDMEKMAQYMGADSADSLTIDKLRHDEAVRDLFRSEMRSLVSGETGFKNFEKVQDFRFVDKPFEPGDELTAVGKMRRHIITEKYQDRIDDMYKGAK
jgi:long-chain acyl-CoA synthetase